MLLLKHFSLATMQQMFAMKFYSDFTVLTRFSSAGDG